MIDSYVPPQITKKTPECKFEMCLKVVIKVDDIKPGANGYNVYVKVKFLDNARFLR